MVGAVRAAYQDVLARDRHPIVTLLLDGPAAEINVNVHPAKAEVRFRDAALVRGLIIRALRRALDAAGHRASTRRRDRSARCVPAGNEANKAAWEPRFAFPPSALPRELAEAAAAFLAPGAADTKPEPADAPLGRRGCTCTAPTSSLQ